MTAPDRTAPGAGQGKTLNAVVGNEVTGWFLVPVPDPPQQVESLLAVLAERDIQVAALKDTIGTINEQVVQMEAALASMTADRDRWRAQAEHTWPGKGRA